MAFNFYHPSKKAYLFASILLTVVLSVSLQVVGYAQTDKILLVKITHVEIRDQAPQATAFVTVLDSAGLPVVGLNPTNFRLVENEQAIAGGPVAVEIDTTQPLELVLALDLSVHQAGDLNKVKEAAQIFLDALGPQDKVTLITFDNEVSTRLQAASPEAVKPEIAQLPEVVNGRTAFFQAVQQAVQSLTPAGPTRQTVIVITNKGNNIEDASANAARQAVFNEFNRIPIQVISFGNRAKLDQLSTEVAAAPGVQVQHVPNPNSLPVVLQQLAALLRLSYKVSFQPPAGEQATRVLTVKVEAPQGTGGDQSDPYQVRPFTPSLTLGNVPSIRVGETLVVTAAVVMPSSPVTLTYQIGHIFSTTMTAPPYALIWSTIGVPPATYTLTAMARSSPNYSASDKVEFKVMPGVTFIPEAKVYWPDNILLEAKVDPNTPLASTVEFWREVNGQEEKIGEENSRPYQLEFNRQSKGYPEKIQEGENLIVVVKARVKDATGTVLAEERFAIHFMLRPESFRWWEAGSGVLLMLLANFLVLPLLMIVWVENRRQKWSQLLKTGSLSLRNLGNLATEFELTAKATAPSPALLFQFSEIIPAVAASAKNPSPETGLGKQRGAAKGVGTGVVFTYSTSPEKKQSWSARSSGGFSGKSSAAAGDRGGCFNLIVELVEALSAIPLVGQPFRALAGQMRQAQAETGRLQRWPQQVMAPVANLVKRVRSAFGIVAVQTPLPVTHPAGLAPAPLSDDLLPAPVSSQSKTRLLSQSALRPRVSDWAASPTFITSLVAPGKTVNLKLFIQPDNVRRQAGCYYFELTCRPTNPEPGEINPKSIEQAVQLGNVSWWYGFFWLIIPMLVIDVGYIVLLLSLSGQP
ncbi:MAG: VWA domain-containing protein [Anaerolineae bacterium]|nr:VWA domain-containing protein [Anaerolineae bacterium]